MIALSISTKFKHTSTSLFWFEIGMPVILKLDVYIVVVVFCISFCCSSLTMMTLSVIESLASILNLHLRAWRYVKYSNRGITEIREGKKGRVQ